MEESFGPFEASATSALVALPTESTIAPLPDPGRPEFDGKALRALLNGPHGDVKDKVWSICSRPEFAYQYDISISDYRRQVLGWLQALADEGLGALGTPAELAGAGDPGGFLAAFGTLGHHDLSLLTKFGVQFGLFVGAVQRLGTAKHHDLVTGALQLDPLGCFAMTETGHGSNVAGLETTATYIPSTGGYEIHTPNPLARKDYIGGAAEHATVAVVFAQLRMGDLGHGIHAFLVPIRTEHGEPASGVAIGDDGAKAGLNGVDNGHLTFDRVRVDGEALLNRFASVDGEGRYSSDITSPNRRFFTTLGTLVGGRVSVASGAVSVAESALTIALRYATRRRQFQTTPGPETSLIDYPSHRQRLLPRLAATYAYHFACAEAVAEYVGLESDAGDTGEARRVFEGRAAGLKAFATWHTMDTVQECREACGGQGYMAINRLGSMRDDVDVFTTFEGDNTVLAQLLAKSLLTEHHSSFEDLTPGRLLRYLRDRVSSFATTNLPVIGSVGGDRTDPEVAGLLLDRRRDLSLEKLAQRIQRRVTDGRDASEAFTEVQSHAVETARAATEAYVYAAMRRANVDDPALSEILDDVSVLYALWRVEEDLGWFLTHGLLTAGGAKAVRSSVATLCDELAPHARHLVDAFGIPDEVLAAPIAL
ncbi:MAG: acyl-CoA oxidase [Acidimicrobiia bacterium]|nr:acyl-CoA oxidase [Acidimicrobiia bacterium]